LRFLANIISTKVLCKNNSFSHSIQDGFRNLKLSFLIPNLVIPTVSALGMALALPYIFAHSLMPIVLRNPTLLLVSYSSVPKLVSFREINLKKFMIFNPFSDGSA
jgi:hypothetical protein